MQIKSKKKISIKTAVIAGIVLFSLIMPQIAWAGVGDWISTAFPEFKLLKGVVALFAKGPEMTAIAIGEALLMTISRFVFDLLNLIVKLGGLIFNAMLKIGFQSHLEIVKAGWGVTRDFANMLFILFMVIIAFATILRTEKYGIKQLLPKVILIALLINFSLVICSVIIDFSNITANFFIEETRNSIHARGGKGGISGSLTDSLNMAGIYQPIDCSKFSDNPEEDGKTAKQKCLEDAAGKFGANIITFMISITWGSLVMLITAFVFFAGAIMLLIRVVIIWFLVMLVPLVFICYIMPGLQENWRKWWTTFLKWCFFAPAYAFFIWLAVKVAAEGKTFEVAKKMSTEFTGMGAIANAFTSSPALIIHYLFIIALLLGGLITASKFGIYGADVAMKVGQKWGKGLTGITKFEKYKAARKKVKEEGKKEAVKRRLRLREVGGVRQAIKERMPGELGRRARARKSDVIKTESDRMLKHYRFGDMRRVFGYRGFTGFRRTSRLAAGRAMAHPRYASQRRQMQQRSLRHLGQILAKLLRRYGVKRPT